jgi:cell division protein FtsB
MIGIAIRNIPMPQRLSIGATMYLIIVCGLGLYFAFAAVQGPSGILRRIQIEAETADLEVQRDNLRAEVEEIENLTHRLSDDYLDLDLLDERAREVLGLLRSDEIILR